MGRNIGLDVLHGVIDRETRRDAAAGAVNVKLDVLVRVLGFQIQKLGDDKACGGVVDLFGQHDNTVIEQAGEDVVRPLAPAGLLYYIGY